MKNPTSPAVRILTPLLLLAMSWGSPANAKDAAKEIPKAQMKAKAQARAPTLEERLNQVRQASGANMVVLWGAIEKAGIKRSQPVELHLKRVGAGQLLKLSLECASAGLEADQRLSYVIDDGIIWVAPRGYLKNMPERLVSRACDAQDLAMSVPNFTDAPKLEMGVLSGSGGGELFSQSKQ